jgi:hypothetical protein
VYDTLRYVDVGMKVLAPYDERHRIRCVVTVAAGYHARVCNPKYEFEKWFHIDDLRIEPVDETLQAHGAPR